MTTPANDIPRYYSFARYLRGRFGCRVHKVTLDAGFTCPNRDGVSGLGGCTFCNNEGFSLNTRVEPAEVREQLRRGIEIVSRRKDRKVIAYFQAYTNTYRPIDQLKALYDIVWEFPEVVGLAIGTRPDCVNEEILDLIASYTDRGEVWIEYGLQSCHDSTLQTVNRGHDYQAFIDAMDITRGKGIRTCVHTILGLPGEDDAMMMQTHRRLAEMNIDGIKLHLLHVMRNTVMARQYERGEFEIFSREKYVSLIVDILERIPANIVIQRMHADAPEDLLVAPLWCLDKQAILNDIRTELRKRDTWQGKLLGHTLAELKTPQPLPATH